MQLYFFMLRVNGPTFPLNSGGEPNSTTLLECDVRMVVRTTTGVSKRSLISTAARM